MFSGSSLRETFSAFPWFPALFRFPFLSGYLVFCNLIFLALFFFNRVTCVGRIPSIFSMFPFLPPFSLLWILFAGLRGKRERSRSFTACAVIRSMFRISTFIRTVIGHFPLRVGHWSEPARFWLARTNRKRQTAQSFVQQNKTCNTPSFKKLSYDRNKNGIPNLWLFLAGEHSSPGKLKFYTREE